MFKKYFLLNRILFKRVFKKIKNICVLLFSIIIFGFSGLLYPYKLLVFSDDTANVIDFKIKKYTDSGGLIIEKDRKKLVAGDFLAFEGISGGEIYYKRRGNAWTKIKGQFVSSDGASLDLKSLLIDYTVIIRFNSDSGYKISIIYRNTRVHRFSCLPRTIQDPFIESMENLSLTQMEESIPSDLLKKYRAEFRKKSALGNNGSKVTKDLGKKHFSNNLESQNFEGNMFLPKNFSENDSLQESFAEESLCESSVNNMFMKKGSLDQMSLQKSVFNGDPKSLGEALDNLFLIKAFIDKENEKLSMLKDVDKQLENCGLRISDAKISRDNEDVDQESYGKGKIENFFGKDVDVENFDVQKTRETYFKKLQKVVSVVSQSEDFEKIFFYVPNLNKIFEKLK